MPRPLQGLAWCADAALLTGLLDITGGPFNPFIVMFVTYVWLAAVTVSPPWAVLVTVVSAIGFAWLVVDHVQAESVAHHRLNDFPAHLFTMWFAGAAIAELVAHYVSRARAALARARRRCRPSSRARTAARNDSWAMSSAATGSPQTR